MSTKTKDYIRIALAWLFVGVPLLWGVLQTIEKSLALFGN